MVDATSPLTSSSDGRALVSEPYLSVVVVGRNDGYGGDFLGRTTLFLDSVAHTARSQHLPVEVVMVEWNPPAYAPPLAEALRPLRSTRRSSDRLPVRFVTDPPELHQVRDGADLLPIFEFAAKNVGIRRAKGEYLLCSNPDVILSKELARYIGRRSLQPRTFYRADRYDVTPPPGRSRVRATRAWAGHHVVSVNRLGESIAFDPPATMRQIRAELRRRELAGGSSGTGTEQPQDTDPLAELHTNAAGDFMLMRRDEWEELGGYPELVSPWHVDAYLVAIAASAGLRQVVLPPSAPVFHHEHERAIDRNNLVASTRPVNDYATFREDAEAMTRARKPLAFNDDSWGLAGVDLAERELLW